MSEKPSKQRKKRQPGNRDGVHQRKDTGRWSISYKDARGVRQRKQVEADSWMKAIEVREAIKTQVQTERILGVKSVSDIGMEDFWKRYKKHQKPRIAPSTYLRLDSILANLKAGLPAKLKDITKLSVTDYIDGRASTVAPASIAKEVSVLKHALNLAVEWELIQANPAGKAKLPKLPKGRTRYLSPTEFRATLEAAPDWMRAPLALAAFTGMRRGEMLALRWRDVDLERRQIYLHETKNGELRILPLNGLAMQTILSLPRGYASDKLFPEVDPHLLTVRTRRLFRSLGIEDASFHTLRHTAASWMVMEGEDLYAVSQFLGHKTLQMTKRYAHLSPGYMSRTASKIEKAFLRTRDDGVTMTPQMLLNPAKRNQTVIGSNITETGMNSGFQAILTN